MFIHLFLRTSTALLMLSLLACGGSGPGSGTPTGTLTAINLSPPSEVLTLGATTSLTATGTYSDGSTSNVSAMVTWLTSNQAVATIASGGTVTGVGLGTSTVAVSMSGITSNAATLTVGASIGGTLTGLAPREQHHPHRQGDLLLPDVPGPR